MPTMRCLINRPCSTSCSKALLEKFLRGPRGTALLYVRKAFLAHLRPMVVDVSSSPWNGEQFNLLDDARRFETIVVLVAVLTQISKERDDL